MNKPNKKSGYKNKYLENTGASEFTNTAKLSEKDRELLEKDIREAKSLSAVLIVVRGYPQGKRFSIEKDRYKIGRHPQSDICLSESIISSHHAEIVKEGGDYYIFDCESTNGVYINSEKISGKVKLKKEDMVKIGSNVLKFIPAGELETMYLENLVDAANIDNLTKSFNRNYMDQALNAEFKRAKALKRKMSLIVFDIDNFKLINDKFGHNMGDFVLSELSKIVKSFLREDEILGRYGGDEFVILLWGSSEVGAVKLAEQIRKAVESNKFKLNRQTVDVTISIGVSEILKEHKSVSDLYKAVDNALYESKNFGRNRVSIAVPKIKTKKAS